MEVNKNNFIIYNPLNRICDSDNINLKKTCSLNHKIWQKELVDISDFFNKDKEYFKDCQNIDNHFTSKDYEKIEVDNLKSNISDSDAIKIVNNREGNLLKAGMVLKEDQFPGIHKEELQKGKKPQPIVEGAPSFRKIDNEPLYGTAQPTVEGIKNVLNKLGASPGKSNKKSVVWTNFREEPFVYINGKSFNLRKNSNIYKNINRPGISSLEVEDAEKQLKEEILNEAKKYGGKFLVHGEANNGKSAPQWVTINSDSIKTAGEVYEELQKEGYKVDYKRIPISDEMRPEDEDFDEILNRLKDKAPDSPLVFNCHGGRGRTTTGLVLAGLIRRAKVEKSAGDKIVKTKALFQDVQEQSGNEKSETKSIYNLINLLEKGILNKEEVDKVVDSSDALHNLRTAINDAKKRARKADSSEKRQKEIKKTRDYLDRYFSIIAFDTYLQEQGENKNNESFKIWMNKHPEYKTILINAQKALGVEK